MKLKCALLALSALSSSAFADTFNLSTVVSIESQNKIIKEMIDTFKRGTVDQNAPITVAGTFDLNSDRKLVAINVDHVGFKVINVPLIGAYETDATIKATITNGNCKNIVVTYTKVNFGNPAIVNPIFANDLKNNAAKALDIFIKNSDLAKYCAKETSAESYNVIFY